MSLQLEGVRLPLAPFTFAFEATLAGRVTGVFGASGSGKTTLLEIVAGLRRPLAGRVTLGGSTIIRPLRSIASAASGWIHTASGRLRQYLRGISLRIIASFRRAG